MSTQVINGGEVPTNQVAIQMQTAEAGAAPIPEVPEESTLADTDSRYIRIEDTLPSGLMISAFDKMSIRPFSLAEGFKLGIAAKSGNLIHVRDAVGACLDRPVGSLPMLDFVVLCFWLRLNSYSTQTYYIDWNCTDVDHARDVVKGQVEAKTLENRSVITKTNLSTEGIDEDKAQALFARLTELGIQGCFPLVDDYINGLEQRGMWDDEYSFFADYAMYLNPMAYGSLANRVAIVQAFQNEENGNDKFAALDEWAKYVATLGLKETVTLTCECCGKQQQEKLGVDLLNFFPFRIQ